MNLALVTNALRALRRSGLIWGGVLVALALSVVALWPSMNETDSLAALIGGLPPDLISAFGLEDFGSPVGYLNGQLYAVVLPLALSAMGIMHAAALTAGDEDAGRLELLLALPVSRAGVYVSRFVAVVLMLAAVSAVVGLSVWGTAVSVDMELDASGVVAVTVAVFCLALLHAALAFALAGCGLRAGAVLGGAFGILGLGYVGYAILPLVSGLADIARVSPWHWALAEHPLANGPDAAGAALLLAGTLVLVAIGLVAVGRRTIRTA